MRREYVELGRRLIPFRETADSDEAAWIRYYRSEYADRGSFTWQTLLTPESRCVVVLGEAGSGKSWEFEAQAEVLNSSGGTAFFLRIEDLLDQDILQCLNREDGARLEDWLGGSDRAVFFLDAVDEARLKDTHALMRALRALHRGLGEAFERACIVLSCRVSDWQPKSDLEWLRPYFGDPDGEDAVSPLRPAKPARFSILQLAPLDRNQVRILAEARGIEPVDDFLSEVDEADAWLFAGRPGDTENLIGYWSEHRKLGSLTELIEQDLATKLRERRVSDDPLKPTKVRAGVERLAAAAILCRGNTFLVPDESTGSGSIGSSIDPGAILPDFQPREQRALLARPIFDEATYGRIRFHHRSVREYLAASWLRRLVAQGYQPKIEDLLFHRKHGRQFIAPSLIPVAAWLASSDQGLRRRLLDTEPLALVGHGDPESIDPMDRASMLGKLVTAYADRTPVWLDPSALRRFAHPCFAPTINRLLRDKGLAQHSRYFLLLLVWHGRIAACAAAAYRVATDSREETEIRSLAIRAVGASADEQMLKSLGEYALGYSDLPRSLAGGFFDVLYPRVFGVLELIELIKRVQGEGSRPSDASTFLLTQIFKDSRKTSAADVAKLLPELFALVTQPPLITQSGMKFASQRYAWLLEPLKTALIRAAREVDEIATNAQLCRIFRQSFLLLAKCHDYGIHMLYDLEELQRSVSLSPALKRAMFWDRVAEQADGSERNYFLDSIPRLGPADLAWLLQDAEDLRLSLEQRRVAFEAAVLHWSWKAEEENLQRDRLRAVAVWEPSFREYLQQAEDNRQRTRAEQSREAAERETKKERQRLENLAWLQRHLDEIRSGKHANALSRLADLARQKSSEHQFGAADWCVIREEFGDDVADAARDGAIAFWRTWQPPFPHEGPPNQTPGEVAIGLAGIAWEVERGLKLSDLSHAEAEYALRYAFFERNGFPKWLAQLANTHPGIVLQLMAEALTVEFDGHSGMLLESLSYAEPSLQSLLAPKLEELVHAREPKNLQSLKYVLSILLAVERKSSIATIAKLRVPTLLSDRPRQMEWLTAWFQADPSAALDFIEGLGPEESGSTIAELASRLGSHHPSPKGAAAQSSFLKPSILKRLIPLVFARVPAATAQDFDPLGGAVAVDPTDARFFRESILQQLASMPGDEPYRTLTEFAHTPGMETERTRYLQAAEWQASNDCERAFKPEEVYGWERDCLRGPKTSTDLFRVALRRLEALKRDLEQGDFSERELFNSSIDEPIFQKYVSNRLRIASRGQYSVHREEEVDLEKRPDIRLWHAKDLVVTIEVKCANKWTYHELREALEKQLVGKYLRDHKSRHGVLLLGHMGAKDSWKGPDGKKVSFEELTLTLNGEAEQIPSMNPQVSRLAVVGIDFRWPSSCGDLPRRSVRKSPASKKQWRRRKAVGDENLI